MADIVLKHITYHPEMTNKEMLQLPQVQAHITVVAKQLTGQVNELSKAQIGKQVYRTFSYRNSAGFPHAGIYTTWHFHEHKHNNLKTLL